MKLLEEFWVVFIFIVAVFEAFYFFFLSPRHAVPILTYHDFSDSARQGDLLGVSSGRFEEQMAYLKKYAYNVISLDELVDSIKMEKKIPAKSVVITIDDGYQSNYEYAYPVLKKYGFPAMIFVATNRMDTDKKYMTWEEIKEMSRNGISFGSHTKEHPFLSAVTDKDVLWDEIAGSKVMLEEHLGVPVMYFCYPNGVFTEEAKEVLRKAGYKAAVTTNQGKDLSNKRDLYELHRVSMRNGDLSWSLWAKLSGYYNAFRKARNRK